MTGSRYVLAVRNLQASAEYYKNELGFQTWWWEGEGWHFLFRDNIKLMLGKCANEKPASELGDHSYFGYFDVEGIDDLYNEYKLRGVKSLGKIEDKRWGQREFTIKTIDGHRIALGEEILIRKI